MAHRSSGTQDFNSTRRIAGPVLRRIEITVQKALEVTGPYGTVREWSVLPTKPDNHWLDCLVGCAVAASVLGVRVPGQGAKPVRKRKRYTQADLRRP